METAERTSRYSLQREVIYETLKGTKAHPDCETIYNMVREKLPDIGMATVYRNLKKLVSDGLVHTLETTRDSLHYDADISDHAHFICSECGRIIDIFASFNLEKEVEETGFKVDLKKIVFYGVCPDCKR